MKKLLLFFTLIFISSLFPQDKISRIDSLTNSAYKMDIFSGVVLIADKDNTVFLKPFGYADYDLQTPNKTDTKFNIGSIGKLFTQIIITQLVQEGKLDLSDPLGKHFKLFNNENDDKITIIQLLTHSAGLGDYFRIENFRLSQDKYRSVEALTTLISKEPLLYEPGTSEEYSNSSYVVLGSIIEKLTGKTYYENLKERILNKLGMENSGFFYKDSKKENTAKGFIVSYSGEKVSTYERMPNIPTPAGGMYSTADDLLKLDRSLMNGNLLLEDKNKILLLNGFNELAGITWQEMKAQSDFGLGIAGGSPGWNAVYDQNIAGEYTVIILSNYDQGAEKLIKSVNGILLGKDILPLNSPAGKIIYETIKEKGTAYFENNYKVILNGIDIEDDGLLNGLGYDFMRDGKTEEAISVFIVNTKLFPDVANTFDSLGEAYLTKGNKELTIENYSKAFEMDPQNKNAERIIKELTNK